MDILFVIDYQKDFVDGALGFAGVDLEAEYDHCLKDMGFTPEDLVKMSGNSIRAAFLPQEKKKALLESK